MPPRDATGRGAERLAGALAALVAVAALGIAWAPLVTDAAAPHVVTICALALLPVFASWAPAWRRAAVVAAGAIAVVLGAALALGIGPLALVATGDGWAALGGLLPDGLAAASTSNLPVSRAEVPALAALLDVALLGLAGAAAWQLTAGRTPVWAIVALGVGLAYRWTVLPPERPLLAGDARARRGPRDPRARRCPGHAWPPGATSRRRHCGRRRGRARRARDRRRPGAD